MPTTKTRINLTVPVELHEPLAALARLENVRVSTKALALLGEAIAREEDMLWTELAEARRKEKKKWVSHKTIMRTYA